MAHHLVLFAFTVTALFVQHTVAQNFFPCHPNSKQMGMNVKCKQIKLPPTLCTACPLHAPTLLGGFKQCWNIYDTKAPGCFDAMKEYSIANPCDVVRKDMVASLEKNPNNAAATNVMDYFLYSVCEQCCDCVPMGSDDRLYDTYKAEGTLMDAYRGNCAAHAFYDICKIFPEVHAITDLTTTMPPNTPPACGKGSELDKWFNSPASRNWDTNPRTTLSAPLKSFIDGMMGAASCTDKKQWLDCYDLEEKQKKLGVTPAKEDVKPIIPTPTNSPPAVAPPGVPAAATVAGSPVHSDVPVMASSAPSATASPAAILAPAAVSPSASIDGQELAGSTAPSGGVVVPLVPETPAPTASSTAQSVISPFPNIDGSVDSTGNPGIDTLPDSPLAPDANPESPFPLPATGPSAPPIELGPLGTPQPDPGQCFPASATVQLEDGATVAMNALKVGDLVHVGNERYEPVFMFSHADPNAFEIHVRITLADTRSITLTPGHLLSEKYAGEVRVGDRVDNSVVSRVERMRERGLYNPNTASGYIVVNGVRTTTFTRFVDAKAAQAWLAPLRALYSFGVNPLSVASRGVHRLLW